MGTGAQRASCPHYRATEGGPLKNKKLMCGVGQAGVHMGTHMGRTGRAG